jgi:hypothetical protein
VATNQTLIVVEHQVGVSQAPVLMGQREPDGAVRLTASGENGFRYAFEGSADLVQWTKLAVRTNLTGTVEYLDVNAPNFPQRFYRALIP